MPEQGIRSVYSQCPVQIQMWDDDGILSTGTAFFFKLNEQWFLITNWHNVSGRHFLTDEVLSPSGRTPTFLKAKFAFEVASGGSFTTVAQKVEIYQNYEPVWFESPELASSCDVIAIPLERPRTCPSAMHSPANLISNDSIPIEPGCTVFIIGFPKSISVHAGLPLWKSGYIASEPYFDVTLGGSLAEVGGLIGGRTIPAFFIDSQTRDGMSGSPVFASYTGTWDPQKPYSGFDFNDPSFKLSGDVFIGSTGREFVGCYSGRVGKLEDGAALGLCWRRDTIEKICAGGKVGQHPHIF